MLKFLRRCINWVPLFLFFVVFPTFADQTLLEQYQSIMKTYPATGPFTGSCKSPDILANPQTRQYRTTLRQEFKEKGVNANFCGKYFMFIEPITGGGMLFLSNCATGKITTHKNEYASTDRRLASVESCLLVEHPPAPEYTKKKYGESAYGPPRLYLFKNEKFEKLPDPVWPTRNKSGSNQICEAFCTYVNSTGAISRIALTTLGTVARSGWQILKDSCLEIQGIAGKKTNNKLLVSNPNFDGDNYPELFEATEKNACRNL